MRPYLIALLVVLCLLTAVTWSPGLPDSQAAGPSFVVSAPFGPGSPCQGDTCG